MDKKSARIRRATRARKKISELAAHRLVVNRTPRHIYAQLIAPSGSEVLASASTVETELASSLKGTGNSAAAAAIGKAIAERAIEKGIKNSERASSVIATAEGALNEISSLLLDIKGLLVESANKGALASSEIDANQLQVDSAINSIERISNSTTIPAQGFSPNFTST